MTLDLFENINELTKSRVNRALKEEPPHLPGVYLMYNAKEEVLYVGKAKDLRNRITSYRYAQTKKIRKMLSEVERIRFEICQSETDALLMENMLIRSIRPPYNTANKSPETYYFVSTLKHKEAFEIRLSMRQFSDYHECFGSFKGHVNVRKGVGALIRLHLMIRNKITNAMFLPQHLLRKLVPLRTMNDSGLFDREMLRNFLNGKSDELIHYLIDECYKLPIEHAFTESFIDHELNALTRFYFSNPRANYLMNQELNLGTSFISQQERDDLLVLLQK